MQKITFENSAGIIKTFYNNQKPFLLQDIIGIGNVPVTTQNQKAPFQDGVTYLGSQFEQREISFDIWIFGDNQSQLFERRKEISDLFNPKLEKGVLIYENDYISKRIEVVVDTSPIFCLGVQNQFAGRQRASIVLLAPNPYWEDITEINQKMVDFVDLFELPFELPVEIGLQADILTITNSGSVETPLEIEFRGPATAPLTITYETTNEFITVTKSLLTDEKMIITTAFGNKKATFVDALDNESSAFNDVSIDSIFFDLKAGDNRISFETGGGDPEVFIKYRQRYVGL